MVLGILDAVYHSAYFPSNYFPHILVSGTLGLALRTISQGRKTNRDRDLHARVILMTGAFTPLGMTVMANLAGRGAHVIALTEGNVANPQSQSSILVDLLRDTTKNEEIYAEHCDLYDPSSIKDFVTKFMSQDKHRIDVVLLLHEYQHLGPFKALTTSKEDLELERQTLSLASFHLVTTLLPGLLLAPPERDIRIISAVNRFYAAAATARFSIPFSAFSTSNATAPTTDPVFVAEGTRALKTVIFMRHLQRVLDALPTAQIPKTDAASSHIPVVSAASQKSNIVAVSVSPGLSRVATVAPLLNADWTSPFGFSYFGLFLYLALQLILRLTTKSAASAMQTILHAIFLPTPFKVIPPIPDENAESAGPIDRSLLEIPEEVLKPGALYAECSVVKLVVPALPPAPQVEEDKPQPDTKGKGKAGEEEPTLDIPDDGEFGGEAMGRAVWESYEAAVKVWQKRHPKEDTRPPAESNSDGPKSAST
ncbi:hypothetical protein CYLTODRAFT_490280 [Cylindrobasidium torrendii FP15055 ss-10]|uniref:Ketoreductase (KR) domain-containing protein n=1 Tax=Cylindrobasidium torrendii FP15055 ss-10 TaxID=1314674 RepID=A0A0D7BBH7_9AGAR|nr:hypothetical protein CYLTODRAFT_490280 [Cylindrobasidium torrendii FP15055 ss-10]